MGTGGARLVKLKLTISHPYTRMFEIIVMIAKRSELGMFAAPISYDGMEINHTTLGTINKRMHRKALKGLSQKAEYELTCKHDDDYVMLKMMLA